MRISDWSSDVCSSDLGIDNAQQILRSGGLQPCNQILLEFSERRHDPLIAMARHCIQYMTHKPRRRLGLWRQTIADAFGKQARWNLGHGHRFSGTGAPIRSEEHTSELQSLMRLSYADFCLKKKKNKNNQHDTHI